MNKTFTDAFSKAKNKQSFRAAHEAELVVFEVAKSTLLAMQDDEKLPSLKSLQTEQQRLNEERARLKKEANLNKNGKGLLILSVINKPPLFSPLDGCQC